MTGPTGARRAPEGREVWLLLEGKHSDARFARRPRSAWRTAPARRWTGAMKIRSILTLAFTVIALLPIAALGLWFDRAAYDKEVDAVHEKHLLLAGNMSSTLSRYATDLISAFWLARLQRRSETIPQGLISHLASQHFRSVFWVRASDFHMVRQIGPERDFQPGPIEAVLEAAAVGGGLDEVAITGVLPDGRGRPTVFLVADEGDGLVSLAALGTDFFVELQSSISFGELGHAAIVDQHGKVLGHATESWRASMRDLTTVEPVARMVAGATGVADFYSPAKRADMIAGYTAVPGTGWGIMVVQPIAELAQRAASGRNVIALVMALGILFAGGVSWAFSGYLTRSILPIVAAAEANAAGRFGVEATPPSRFAPKELRQLAGSFNVLAREIRSSHQSNLEALEAARRAEVDYREIFDEVAIGIYRTSPGGRLLRANPALVRLNGYDTEQEMLAAVQDIATELYVEPKRHEVFKRLLLERGRVTDFVSETYRHATGERIWISEDARAVRDAAGRLLYFEGTVQEITERKRAQEALRRAIEAETANRTKSEFLATVSHELRTPLNAIIGFSEMMRRQTFGAIGVPRYAGYVDDIHESGLHLLDLIDDLLDLSKIEAGKLELHDEVIDLTNLIPNVLHKIEPHRAQKNLSLDVELGHGLPRLLADSRATERMLLNLLSNAVKFTPERGAVKVRAFVDNGGIRLAVEDNGIGIEADDLEKVLAPFGQAEAPMVRTQKGTGLGLPIVRSLIAMHGGSLDLRSADGEGTVVTLGFPAGRSVRKVA